MDYEHVLGDSHSMFRCFHVFEPSKSFADWREAVCEAHQAHHQSIQDQALVLHKANQALRGTANFVPFESFAQYIGSMKDTQWGWTELLLDFLKLNKAEAVIFSASGGETYMRPADLLQRRKTYFLYQESKDSQGTFAPVFVTPL